MYASIVFLPLFGALIAGWLSLGNRDRAAELVTVSFLLLSLLFSIVAFAQVGIGGQPKRSRATAKKPSTTMEPRHQTNGQRE